MMSFYKAMYRYYRTHGYDHTDASRHARADCDYWRNILCGVQT